MQGSRQDEGVQTQGYRQVLAQAIVERHPEAEIVDPWAIYTGAIDYSPEQAAQTLMEELELVAGCDLLVAYLPEASMGTSLEMWTAYEAGIPVLAISKMTRNWVVQTLSAEIHATLEDFLKHVENGGLSALLDEEQSAG